MILDIRYLILDEERNEFHVFRWDSRFCNQIKVLGKNGIDFARTVTFRGYLLRLFLISSRRPLASSPLIMFQSFSSFEHAKSSQYAQF